jgi:hypothetical protein
MARNFQCPETEALCVETRCKRGKFCFEQEKQLAADNLGRAAEEDLKIRRWKSRQEISSIEYLEKLQKSTGAWFNWARKKNSKNSN